MEVALHEPDDLALAAATARGDDRAFTQLFQRYYPMIHALAYRLSLDVSLAEEIAHETFLKAARSIESFRGDHSFKGWLYRIAANSSRDALRRRRRETEVTKAFSEDRSIQEEGRSAEFDDVAAALAALSEDLRAAVTLVYFEDLSHAEAAAILGCAETTVSWRLFRAKQKLRKLLQ